MYVNAFLKASQGLVKSLRNRYLFCLLLVAGLKLLVSLWVYGLIVAYSKGAFALPWMMKQTVNIGLERWWALPIQTPSWTFLFQGWDSPFYVLIARSGYSFPFYTFSPAFPALIKAFTYVLGDVWVASSLVSIIIGLAWVPVFQKLAEQYLTEHDALEATILAATFPYVFLFTTVAYTEGLFTLTTLAAWFLHLKKKHLPAALLASIATLTRMPGILIILPMIINSMIIKAKPRATRLSLIIDFPLVYLLPVAALGSWFIYVQLTTGSWYTIFTSGGEWGGKNASGTSGFWLLQMLTLHPLNPMPVEVTSQSGSIPAILTALAFASLFFLLATKTWSMDRALAVYSWLLMVFLLYFGYTLSQLRFFSFIFPSWLMLRTGSRIGLVLVTGLFLVASGILWFFFLIRYFVG